MNTSRAFSLPHRGVVRVSGPDTASFLDTLLTCRTADLAAGAPRYGALLTPQGKIIAELFVHRDDDALLLDMLADQVADLIRRLTLFKLRAKIAIDDASADVAVVQDFAAAGGPRGDGAGGRRLVAPSAAAAAPSDGYHAARIARGLPEQGFDYGAQDAFPADVNLDLLHGVDFAKGCFVGQEVVSRMKRRGSVRKRTLVVEADGDLAPGADILADGARLGVVTSAAGGAGLAQIRLDRLAATAEGAAVSADGAPVRLTFPDWFPETARWAETSA